MPLLWATQRRAAEEGLAPSLDRFPEVSPCCTPELKLAYTTADCSVNSVIFPGQTVAYFQPQQRQELPCGCVQPLLVLLPYVLVHRA